MSAEKQHHDEPEVVIQSAIGQTEAFIERNSKLLVYILVAVIAIAAGYFGWKYLYALPQESKAADTAFVAEQLFQQGEWQQALEGDGNNAGFNEVIDRFGSTSTGNLARQYAGVCLVKLGKADEALAVLTKYRHVKGAPGVIISAQNYGMRGDILADKGQYEDALALYRKAIAAATNPLTTPVFLKKAGLLYEKTGDKGAAKECYQRIADEFGSSMEARDIEKSLGRAQE